MSPVEKGSHPPEGAVAAPVSSGQAALQVGAPSPHQHDGDDITRHGEVVCAPAPLVQPNADVEASATDPSGRSKQPPAPTSASPALQVQFPSVEGDAETGLERPRDASNQPGQHIPPEIGAASFQASTSTAGLPFKSTATELPSGAPSHSLAPVVAQAARLSELKRFTLWETRTHFYLVAYNTSQTAFRILKLDRIPERHSADGKEPSPSADKDGGSATSAHRGNATGDGRASDGASIASHSGLAHTSAQTSTTTTAWDLNVTADRVVYTRSQISELLDMISEGNKSSGGLREVGRFFGIVGFIRFTSTYHMVLISRRSVVALIGGHYVYHCDDTHIIPVCPPSVLANVGGRTKALEQEEARLLHTFKQVDLSKNFYFSYTYDLTKTLQDNLTSAPRTDAESRGQTAWGYNEKFVWNHHLLLPAFASSEHAEGDDLASGWVLPLVYGFVDQAKLRVLNSTVQVTMIARRSRHFAGARFLKRGIDEKGHVANDVETEQIVCDALTTPFHAPRGLRTTRQAGTSDSPRSKDLFGPNPRYTSYVMHRGSIPVYWTQDSTNMSPRPPIEISVVDPYYSSAALHFDDMFRRYGSPIVILNLIKSKEKQPREVKLLNAFGECVSYLNQFLPAEKRLRYIAWDMSRASKSRDQDVIGVLEDIAEETIAATKFFHSGPEPARFAYARDKPDPILNGRYRDTILLQSGIARVNCVDCLDRTNAAQFVTGKAAFGHQLYALGLLDHPRLPFDSDAIDMLTEMYHDLGDTIALQYGGSHLVNTMETYRKINQWTSHSRDMLEGLKRYYANSFVDAEKQAAINLFLGVDNDAPEFRPVAPLERRNYQRWFTPEHLQSSTTLADHETRLRLATGAPSDFWAEYYRPSLFTDLMRHHAFKMTAVHQQAASSANPHDRIASSSTHSAIASPRHSSFSSPASKPIRGRFNSISSATISNQAETTMSPFTSRVPISSPSKESSARLGAGEATPSAGSPPQSQRTAIIGGVRRWISLNRGHEEMGKTSRSSSMQGSRAADGGESGSNADAASGKPAIPSMSDKGSPGSNDGIQGSAWPTWEEITGAPNSLPGTGPLLESLMSPSVSADEVKEYASWLSQFRDVAFEGGPEHAIPEPAALLSASHASQNAFADTFSSTGDRNNLGVSATRARGRETALVGGGSSLLQMVHNESSTGRAALASQQYAQPQPSLLAMMPMGISVRRPATQKQRQQVAEADALLYASEVAVASGLVTPQLAAQATMTTAAAAAAAATTTTPSLTHAMAAGGTDGAADTSGVGQRGGHASATDAVTEAQLPVEPAMLNYPLAAGILHAQASDAKVRAYTQWLAGHHRPTASPRIVPAGAWGT